MSENQLLSLVKEGNQIAFKAIYDKYWDQLYIYAYNILNDKWLTEDVLHEVFVNVWLKREEIEIRNLKHYLFNAIRNRALTKIRNKHKFTELDEQTINKLEFSPEIIKTFEHKDLIQKIEIATNNLPARCRSIFYKSKFHNYTNDEIADHFNISRRTVDNQISIALKHLRKVLFGLLIFLLLFL